jgi:hypothetical protein
LESNTNTFIGAASLYGTPANTGLSISGLVSVCALSGGSFASCITAMNIGTNALLTASSIVFKLNTNDIIQAGASHMTLSACTFAITTSSTDIDIQISGTGTYAEIIGCQFNGKDISSIPGSSAIYVSGGATVNINGGGIKNYTTALQVGTVSDTSTTQLLVSSFEVRDCTSDIIQRGTSTLSFNSGTASSTKIIINNSTNVKLAFFNLDFNSALEIGTIADVDTALIQVATATSSNPGIEYISNLYSSKGIGVHNPTTNNSSLFAYSEGGQCDIISTTTDRTKSTSLNLFSDTSGTIGSFTALRGWSVKKNATSAELAFRYQNSDLTGQVSVPIFTLAQLDGVNNQFQLPTANTQIVFGGDTNLYRSAANQLRTDDAFVPGTLTANRVVITNASTELASSTVTSTELGFLSGVTSNVQTQISGKVNNSGDTMTGVLQLTAGTTIAPSLVFTGSTTTGLSATSSNLSFSTSALERLKISSAGTISINGFTTSGVVHNDATGNLSTSLIVNADISATAAIVDTKLNTIATAGKVSNSATTATSVNTFSAIVARDGSGNFSAGTITANLTGTATNATTAVNFSGSLVGDVTGTQSATVVSTVGGQTAANVATGTVLANNATNLNTANQIVRRDASGNFSAGTITASLNGNATTATTSTSSTNFSGSLSGDVTGTQGATVVSTVGGQTAANVSAATVLANNATNLNTASTIVRRDVGGNFSAGTITASLNGNATTSTSSTNFSGLLAGDVTGTQSATVVSLVGGQTAASVASATVLANNSTNLSTASTIVRRDGGGSFSAGTVTLFGNLDLPNSLSSQGNITRGGQRFLSARGTQNIYLGLLSGNFTSSASNCIGIGGNSLIANVSGSDCIAIGLGALSFNQTGINNIAIGNSALASQVSNANCTAVGHQSQSNATGDSNSSFGYDCLSSLTSGNTNSGFGVSCLSKITNLGSCTGFGHQCLQLNTSAQMVAFGTQACKGNTTGVRNSGFGFQSLLTNSTANDNTAAGHFSLNLATSSNNSAFGSFAGQLISGGGNNSMFGANALNTCGLGTDNSVFGYNSGTNITSGNFNAFFGSGAGSAITTTSNNICISNNGVIADAGVIRIGTPGTHLKNFQAGIRGITGDTTDSIPVYITSTGQLTSVSNSKASGSIYGAIASQLLTTATWTLLTGIATSTSMSNFDRPADNRLRYTGTTTVNAMVTCSLTIQANTTTNLFIALTKNGVTPSISFAGQGGISVTSGVNVNFSPSGVFSLATNDYVSVWVFSTTASATTVSGSYLTLSAMT